MLANYEGVLRSHAEDRRWEDEKRRVLHHWKTRPSCFSSRNGVANRGVGGGDLKRKEEVYSVTVIRSEKKGKVTSKSFTKGSGVPLGAGVVNHWTSK